MKLSTAVLVAHALAFAALAGCGWSSPPRPHVVFISLDTFRKDALGLLLESGDSITPRLDRFGRDSVEFSSAFAPMPFTLPSHMSMLTGLYPDVHGVHLRTTRLGTGLTTLPEAMKQAGYSTIGLVTNDWMKGDFGFSQGFDHYETVPTRLTFADRVTHRAFELVEALPDKKAPLFLFLHYLDAHSDFHQQGDNTLPYYTRAALPPHCQLPREGRFCDRDDNCATAYLLAADKEKRKIPPEEIEEVRCLYLAGIRELDVELGRLFDELRARGLYDSSLIVLTSDHGEEFREHGLFIHSQPYDESLAVPLLVKFPDNGYAGRIVDRLVRHIDLMPTILDYLGIEPPVYVQGQSLLPSLRQPRRTKGAGADASTGIEVLSQDKLRRQRYALRTTRYKLIYDFKTDEAELYDLAADPRELRDISASSSRTVARLLDRLITIRTNNRRLAQALSAASESDGADLLDEEEIKRLRSIGYLG